MTPSYSQRTRARHPDHYRARNIVRVARRNGTLVPGPCEMLDDTCMGRIEAHHQDYGKPLDVQWLCRRHHLMVDRHKTGRRRESGASRSSSLETTPEARQ